jgi:pimeloyl-ACP methyl ester carboxylesterase
MVRGLVISVVLGMTGAIARAQVAPSSRPATQPAARVGAFHATFQDQSPLSRIEAQSKRHHIKVEPLQRYELSRESFEVWVPEDYARSEQSYGILVWVNAGDRGSVPRAWLPVLEEHRLIWIGANDSGNERGVGVRFGLALDAVHNLKALYRVDESRVYVAGISGGGKVASMLAIIYPEIFNGAIPIVGVAYFRHLPVPTEPNQSNEPRKLWPGMFERPPTPTLDRAREQGRFVLITGSDDFNRDPIKGTYELGFLKDGFRHVQYVEVAGMGHTIPDAQTLSRAIESLDAPLPEIRAAADASAARIQPRRAKSPTPATTPAAPRRAAPTTVPSAPSPETEAQRLLSLAENYVRNGLYAEARERLEKILRDYPDTKSAARAKQEMERIKAREKSSG